MFLKDFLSNCLLMIIELHIIQVYNAANYKNDPYVKGFGIDVSTKMTEVDARVIDPPEVKYQVSLKPVKCYCE